MKAKAPTDILTEPVFACPLCGEKERKILYGSLEDRLFGAPGKWNLKSCIACGLVYLDPRPTVGEIRKIYTDSYSTRKVNIKSRTITKANKLRHLISQGFLSSEYGYFNKAGLLQHLLGKFIYLSPYWREQLSFRVMRLPYKSGGRLLDIGCGIGGLLTVMSRLGWEVEGLDTDIKVVMACRSQGLNVKEGTVDSQNYSENYFDAITMKHLIEHVYDPIDLLKESKRILKPGGKLVIITPNLESLGHETFREIWRGLDVPRHLVLFSSKTLSRATQQAGLKVIELFVTARSDRWNWIVSYNLKKYNKNFYFSQPNLSSRFMEIVFDKKVRLWHMWNKKSGDEIALVATK